MSVAVADGLFAEDLPQRLAARTLGFFLRPLHLLFKARCALFLLALTAMLLRHPDVQFYEIDRIAFGMLVLSVVGGLLVLRERPFVDRASWPMLAILALVLSSISTRPFDHETWSLLASKFLVPFALFHMAAIVFREEKERNKFETFALAILAYLSFTAIAFLVGAKSLIFPRFILDESLGFHADRARGPLLQAVANGVSLNILGLLAVHAYQRGSKRNRWTLAVLISLKVAILATMTRTVWVTFAGTVLALIFMSESRRWRVWALLGALAVALVGGTLLASSHEMSTAVTDRAEEQGPVDFRKAVYAGGWEMFWQHPVLGWGFHRMPAELPRYVSGYQEKVLYPHNTFLELLVENGVVGFAAYTWLMWELWRLRWGGSDARDKGDLLDGGFHRIWPLILIVYWVNAALVVMSYQFVNGLVLTVAGMLAGQRRSAELKRAC